MECICWVVIINEVNLVCYELGQGLRVYRECLIFGEDLASAYVLSHQMSTVLEFQAKGIRFGGLDNELHWTFCTSQG